MTVHRLRYANMKTTYRVEINDIGVWVQFGERGFMLRWK